MRADVSQSWSHHWERMYLNTTVQSTTPEKCIRRERLRSNSRFQGDSGRNCIAWPKPRPYRSSAIVGATLSPVSPIRWAHSTSSHILFHCHFIEMSAFESLERIRTKSISFQFLAVSANKALCRIVAANSAPAFFGASVDPTSSGVRLGSEGNPSWIGSG